MAEQVIRTFPGGATRDEDTSKPDYEGYLSPAVLYRYGQYMKKHQVQSDGVERPSDNWQNGIPKEQYMKSMWRHFMDVWSHHRGVSARNGKQDALCALMFNVMGYLFEEMKDEQ